MNNSKKGVFFTLDALFALVILFSAAIIVYPTLNPSPPESFISSDLIQSLSTVSIGELNNSYAKSLIASGNITNENKTVLETLAELYITNKTIAKQLADSIFSDIIINENVGIWFGNELIASKNSTNYAIAKKIETNGQFISGIQSGQSVTAFSARAFLSSSLQDEYFYFGGYVGEGNITARIEYSGNISSAKLELAIPKDFDVYVNGAYAGHFLGIPSPNPATYVLPTGNFSSGVNYVELRGDNLGIAGGFLKVSYSPDISYVQSKRYYFPGIIGTTNLYDSFYIPSTLASMSIVLEYENNLTSFLRIGNTTVFNRSTSGPENITLNNSFLSSLLSYSSLSQKNVPLRFGLENASYVTNSSEINVFSVTDLSGSMGAYCSGASFWCCVFSSDFCSSEPTCNSCGGNFEDKIGTAKAANHVFINDILNVTTNKVGLVGYRDKVYGQDFYPLSNDNTSLHAKVDSWYAGGGTCICCGINNATQEIVANGNPASYESIIVMSDGEANYQCPEQGTGTATGDAIQAACDAYNNYGIIVYAIGVGAGADESTLQSIASCGGGSYYFSDIARLVEIYDAIADEIIKASYSEQTVNILGNYISTLSPDSYIELNYTQPTIPYGLVTTSEETFDTENSGTFSIPDNASVIEARVISYSGSKWTDAVWINNILTFNLSEYGFDYLLNGDPYSITLPNNTLAKNNTVNLTTGLSPYNSSGGSLSNKIIYTILQGSLTAYSSLSGVADGCNWTIQFKNSTETNILVPSTYGGIEACQYTSTTQAVSNTNDAMQVATRNLLSLLDYDSDGIIDVEFSKQDLQISASQISSIPYDWSTEVQIRTWS